jgi:hypothetical protein
MDTTLFQYRDGIIRGRRRRPTIKINLGRTRYMTSCQEETA